jgi:hypothetical protein
MNGSELPVGSNSRTDHEASSPMQLFSARNLQATVKIMSPFDISSFA